MFLRNDFGSVPAFLLVESQFVRVIIYFFLCCIKPDLKTNTFIKVLHYGNERNWPRLLKIVVLTKW